MRGLSKFERAWEKFTEESKLQHGGHTDPDWRGDHTLSAAFVIPVEVGDFVDRIAPLRDAIRPFPFVSLHPDYFMHISLVLIGFVDERAGELPDLELHTLAENARSALSSFGEFEVRLANLGAFPSAAYIEAHDENGELNDLRETLLLGCGLESKPGPPHLTLAYFRAADGTRVPDELIRAIEPYRD
ncbi:MAG: 2'-5' RNA ligase family protein, partial [Rubrobacter sp.]